MNCPKCNTKADEGARICRVCHEPFDISQDSAGFVTLLETYDLGQMLLIKSVLESEDMDYYILGENANSMMAHPLPYIIRVSAGQAGLARELLGDML